MEHPRSQIGFKYDHYVDFVGNDDANLTFFWA